MTEKEPMGRDDMDALDELLAAYGADRTRWPAPERLRFAPLLSSSAEARRRLSEAEALDRLLDMAPEPRTDRSALADRIVLAAVGEAKGRQVIQLPSRRGAGSVFGPAVARAKAFGASAVRSGQWAGGALLAASLVLGAFMGTTGAVDSALRPLTVASADETEADTDSNQIAGLETGSLFEEDLL